MVNCSEDVFQEKVYLLWDVVPIAITTIVGALAVIIVFMCECLNGCCNLEEGLTGCNCTNCHCEECGHLRITYDCVQCRRNHPVVQCSKCSALTINNDRQQQTVLTINNGRHQQPVTNTSSIAKEIFKFIRMIGSGLVKMLYGDEFYLIRTEPEQVDIAVGGRSRMYVGNRPIKPKASCLHAMLVATAITLATLLSVVFLDVFIIDSYKGCNTDHDCYVEDDKYDDYPITDCTEYLSKDNGSTICYEFSLNLYMAASNVGGIFVAATLMLVIIAKLTVCCLSCSMRKKLCCTEKFHCESDGCQKLKRDKLSCCYKLIHSLWQLIPIFFLFACMTGYGWFLKCQRNQYVHGKTALAFIGTIIQLVTLVASSLLAVFTPWIQLIDIPICTCPENISEPPPDPLPKTTPTENTPLLTPPLAPKEDKNASGSH